MSNFKKDRIFTTRNYSMFKDQLNRDTTTVGAENHIRKLMVKFKKFHIGVPIIVNRDMTIVNGQHTLEAYRRLGFPVSYIISNQHQGTESILSLNTVVKTWSTSDYLSFHLSREEENNPIGYQTRPYHVYNWFRTRYKLPHRSVIEILCTDGIGSGTKPNDMFKNGNLKIRHIERAKEDAEYVLSLKEHTKEYRNRSFLTAILNAMRDSRFNRKRWIQKLKLNPRWMVHSTNAYDCMANINEIYNWNARIKVNFALKNERSSGVASRRRAA
jgi:hypothetical protein